MKKTTVKTAEGKIINIKSYQKSLTTFPSYRRAMMSDKGEPYLMDCVTTPSSCGCEIIGHGTLQFPLKIKFCNKHQQPNRKEKK